MQEDVLAARPEFGEPKQWEAQHTQSAVRVGRCNAAAANLAELQLLPAAVPLSRNHASSGLGPHRMYATFSPSSRVSSCFTPSSSRFRAPRRALYISS